MKTNLIDPATRAGRIRLHLACIRLGGSAAWHFKGILREISEAMTLRSPRPACS